MAIEGTSEISSLRIKVRWGHSLTQNCSETLLKSKQRESFVSVLTCGWHWRWTGLPQPGQTLGRTLLSASLWLWLWNGTFRLPAVSSNNLHLIHGGKCRRPPDSHQVCSITFTSWVYLAFHGRYILTQVEYGLREARSAVQKISNLFCVNRKPRFCSVTNIINFSWRLVA